MNENYFRFHQMVTLTHWPFCHGVLKSNSFYTTFDVLSASDEDWLVQEVLDPLKFNCIFYELAHNWGKPMSGDQVDVLKHTPFEKCN